MGHSSPVQSRVTRYKMSVTVSENIVPDLRISFNPVVVVEPRETEDAVLECLDSRRFPVVRRELAENSGFFK